MGKGTYLHHLGVLPSLGGAEQHLLTTSAFPWKPLRAAECICCLVSLLVISHVTAWEIIAPTHPACQTDVRDGDGYICSQIKKQFKTHLLPAVALCPVSFQVLSGRNPFFLNQPYPFLQSSCAVLCLAKPQQQPPGNVARVVQTTLADWDAFAGSPGAVHSTQWGGEDASGWKLEISSSSLFSPEPSNSVVVSA